MNMIDLKRTKAERKEAKDMCVPSPSADDYPYGLCINLQEDELDKLGLDDLPKAGAKVSLQAVAVVKEVSQRTVDGGKESRRLELQIQQLAIEKRAAPKSMEEAIRRGVESANG